MNEKLMKHYFSSTERAGVPISHCEIVGRLRTDVRNDYALIKFVPPIPQGIYSDLGPTESAILVARHVGHSVFDVKEWPLFVNVLIPKKDLGASANSFKLEDISFTDIGVLSDSEELTRKWAYKE